MTNTPTTPRTPERQEITQTTTPPAAPRLMPADLAAQREERRNRRQGQEPRLSMALPPAVILNPLNARVLNTLLEETCKPVKYMPNRRHDNGGGRPFGGSSIACC